MTSGNSKAESVPVRFYLWLQKQVWEPPSVIYAFFIWITISLENRFLFTAIIFLSLRKFLYSDAFCTRTVTWVKSDLKRLTSSE